MDKPMTVNGQLTSRRRILLTAACGAFAGVLSDGARGATWPTRVVRIIVPFPPGGAADSCARVLAELFPADLGQSVIVENRPGAGSVIGVTAAAQSKDGHTLLMGSNSMVINPSLQPAIGYDVARDFDAVGMVSAQPLVLVVPATSPIESLAAFIAAARARPGQVSTGNSGYGTLAHLASEIFATQAGVTLTAVPYKGESALMPDLLAGLVSAGFLNLPSVAGQIKAGKLRALAVSSPEPVPDLPNVQTFRAQGFPAMEVEGWAALLVPKDAISRDGLERLEAALRTALASDPVKQKFATIGVAPMSLDRADTQRFLDAEGKRYGEIIKARGIKAE